MRFGNIINVKTCFGLWTEFYSNIDKIKSLRFVFYHRTSTMGSPLPIHWLIWFYCLFYCLLFVQCKMEMLDFLVYLADFWNSVIKSVIILHLWLSYCYTIQSDVCGHQIITPICTRSKLWRLIHKLQLCGYGMGKNHIYVGMMVRFTQTFGNKENFSCLLRYIAVEMK